jgi:hypothetical protein
MSKIENALARMAGHRVYIDTNVFIFFPKERTRSLRWQPLSSKPAPADSSSASQANS